MNASSSISQMNPLSDELDQIRLENGIPLPPVSHGFRVYESNLAEEGFGFVSAGLQSPDAYASILPSPNPKKDAPRATFSVNVTVESLSELKAYLNDIADDMLAALAPVVDKIAAENPEWTMPDWR